MITFELRFAVKMGFPSGLDCKDSACNAGDLGSIPGSRRSPGVGDGSPLQYSSLQNSMDRGAWQASYSLWGHKESDTTEQLTHTLMRHNIKKVGPSSVLILGLIPDLGCRLEHIIRGDLDTLNDSPFGRTWKGSGLWRFAIYTRLQARTIH